VKVILHGSSNGIDINRFNKKILDQKIVQEIKISLKYEEKNFYLLFLGRLVFDKGIVELINVFNDINKIHPQVKLILVGRYETDLDPLPLNTVEEISNNSSVIYIDWTEIVEYYMSIADCFIFPSHREGFPNVLLQAGAMSLPVVCSNIAGNTDIIENNKTGLTFEKGDEVKMYNSIKFAVDHPEQMKTMAADLLLEINKNYSRESVWKSILSEYQLLLSDT